MSDRIWITVLFILTTNFIVQAQVLGKITDNAGKPLPYTTIYISGTSNGTISNVNGEYQLENNTIGDITIVFQYIGYKTIEKNIFYTNHSMVLNVEMQIDDHQLAELIITASEDDPAISIIKNTIGKRSYYKQLVKNYEADLYIKGKVKITQSPKKVLGENVGDLQGRLDTTGKGIIYLSESISKYYFQYPNNHKEIMLSSIKSGENDLYTANQFSIASFDIYDEFLEFGKKIISPIADRALKYYQYQLVQTTPDGKGHLLHKLKVIPDSKSDPLVSGYIYITDGLWNIQSVDFILAGNAIKSTFMDTVFLKQIYVPIKNPDVYRMLSQVIEFKAGLMGFNFQGNFSYIFSNYDLDKDISKICSSNEVFKVEAKAMNSDTAFWKSHRPIPLTYEEHKDYQVKDSLVKIWNTKTYMDSLDTEENKFKPQNLLLGYFWNNTYKNYKFHYPKPLSLFRFNAVEGWKLNLHGSWEWTDSLFRGINIMPTIQYGFADHIFKPSLHAKYRFDNKTLGYIHIGVGRRNVQFDIREPINETNNTWTSLWNKHNIISVYENNFAHIGYHQEILNGFFVNFKTEYTHRVPVKINSQYSFRRKDQEYNTIIPRIDLPESVYTENQYFKTQINLLFRPKQTYATYPNLKIRNNSEWPNIEVDYEIAAAVDGTSKSYHKLRLRLRDKYVNANLFGFFSYNIESGTFLGTKPSYFGDFFHPIGDELLLPIAPDIASFNLMPYYSYSTDKYYFLINGRHHFNGYIIDKIPLLNKTSLKSVLGFSAMYEPIKGQYSEIIFGLENFRLGPFKLFSIDYTLSFDKFGYRSRGFTIRLNNFFGD